MKPQVITERGLIRRVAERWREAYAYYLARPESEFGNKKIGILSELQKLDLETASSAEVDDIIGNTSWTAVSCNACHKVVKSAVTIGEEPDYESSTATLCFSCIEEAYEALKEVQQ